MKETLLDVLMYLFENYNDGEFSNADNQETLKVELAAAGFPERDSSGSRSCFEENW